MKPHLRLRFTALLTLLIALPHIASAYSFESGGVYYDITSSTEMTVRVTYSNRNNNDYSGIVNIPTSVVYGGNRYFVTAIGDYAFSGCTLLDKVVITANQLTTIGNYAFSGCNGLAEFTVPSKVTSIGNYAFNGCFSLENLTFAKTTKTLSLGYGSSEGQSHALFEDCPLHRVEVTRPLSYSTSSSYGYSPFARQEDLSEIIFDEDITSIPPNMFCLNTAITSYVVPDHITEIGDLAFNGSYIRSITIHNQVTRIGESAFYGSPLKSLVIPPSVESIGNYAFNGCTSLSQLTIEEGEQPLSLGYNCSVTVRSSLFLSDAC